MNEKERVSDLFKINDICHKTIYVDSHLHVYIISYDNRIARALKQIDPITQ